MAKTLKLGVIGAGAFSIRHLDGIRNAPNAEAVAICDINLETAKTRAAEFGVPNVCETVDELLAREDIEAVTLPLPDQVHAEIAIKAMKAGKHVLCEKPMALDLNECKEMIKASKETGMQLMVGQIGRYTPAFVKAKEIYESGALGELFLIESEYAHDYSGIGGTPIGPEGTPWRMTPEREAIIGGGCHAVDLIRMIAGDPVEVFSYANNKCLTDWPIHDCSMSVMKFADGTIGKVMNSHGCKRQYTMRSLLYGTKGTLIFDNSSDTMTLYKAGCIEGMDTRTLPITIPVTVNNHNFAAEVQDFCEAILENRPVVTDGVSGAKTVAVCLAIVDSFTNGKPVEPDYNF